MRFNVLGILDLAIAGIISFLLLRIVEVTPSTAPLTIALHIVSLRRLRTAANLEEDHTAQIAAAG